MPSYLRAAAARLGTGTLNAIQPALSGREGEQNEQPIVATPGAPISVDNATTATPTTPATQQPTSSVGTPEYTRSLRMGQFRAAGGAGSMSGVVDSPGGEPGARIAGESMEFNKPGGGKFLPGSSGPSFTERVRQNQVRYGLRPGQTPEEIQQSQRARDIRDEFSTSDRNELRAEFRQEDRAAKELAAERGVKMAGFGAQAKVAMAEANAGNAQKMNELKIKYAQADMESRRKMEGDAVDAFTDNNQFDAQGFSQFMGMIGEGGSDANGNGIPDAQETRFQAAQAALAEYDGFADNDPKRNDPATMAKYKRAKAAETDYLTRYKKQLARA